MPTGQDLNQAAGLLAEGALVAIPTETVYGLAGNAFDADAVAAIYRVKNRPHFNPLIIHTDSLEKLESWGLVLPEKMKALAAQFSPGPLTYVLPKSSRIPGFVTAGTDAVAVRIPGHPLTLELLRMLDFPVAAPSANPSGYISPTTAQHVEEQLGHQIAYVLDGGPCAVGLESTIISFLHDPPEILRHGGTPVEAIVQIIGPVTDKVKEGGTDNPVAPGMLHKHYAPGHRLLRGDLIGLLQQHQGKRVAVISFRTSFAEVPAERMFVLSPGGSLEEAAQKLFDTMRKADQLEIDLILTEVFPDEGLGKAINDRLSRAAAE